MRRALLSVTMLLSLGLACEKTGTTPTDGGGGDVADSRADAATVDSAADGASPDGASPDGASPDAARDAAADAGADGQTGDVPADGPTADTAGGPDAVSPDGPTADTAGGPDAVSPDGPTTDARGDGADARPGRIVTVDFTGQVSLVSGVPGGLESATVGTRVSGSFAYDTRVGDTSPGDPLRGRYPHNGTSAFTLQVAGHAVGGSGLALMFMDDVDTSSSNVIRFLDGPGLGDQVVRRMTLDGAPAALALSLIFTGDTSLLTSDALPDPFPASVTTPLIFDVRDTNTGGGSLQMRLDALTMR